MIAPIESPRFKKHMNSIPHVFYEISKRRLPIGAITCFLGTESSHSAHSVFSYFLYIHTKMREKNALEFYTDQSSFLHTRTSASTRIVTQLSESLWHVSEDVLVDIGRSISTD